MLYPYFPIVLGQIAARLVVDHACKAFRIRGAYDKQVDLTLKVNTAAMPVGYIYEERHLGSQVCIIGRDIMRKIALEPSGERLG